MKKVLGVLGGMGPMATSVFFERLIKNTQATCDQDHIEMVILNHTSLPDRTRSLQTGNHQPFLDEIKKSFQAFEALEVSHIAIPCNTSHYFYDTFKTMTPIPIIHMVDKTAEVLAASLEPGGRVGVLGTDGTIKFHVYKKSLEDRRLVYVAPEDKTQKKVMDVIYNLKASQNSMMDDVEEIIEHMIHHYGCEKIILACTELSLLEIREDLRSFCIDAMDVLVEESIALSDKVLVQTKAQDTLTSVS